MVSAFHRLVSGRGQRVVIAHDYLTQRGGAERVVLALLRAFPDAPVVTSIYNPEYTYPEFANVEIHTSALQRFHHFRRNPRLAVMLLPQVWKNTVITDADVVISSSTGFAHGVTTDAKKIVYCHNPPRWLYQADDYLLGHGLPTRMALGLTKPYLRAHDKAFAATATKYLANSTIVAGRIKDAYDIKAEVVPPASGVDPSAPQRAIPGIEPGFLLNVARPRGYKNALLVESAVESMPNERLVSVGNVAPEGHNSDRLIRLHDLEDAELRWLYANCSALVAASFEDFGLTVVEAASYGKPSIALEYGGYLDTVVPGLNGILVSEVSTEAIRRGIELFRRTEFSASAIRAHARYYRTERFEADLQAYVNEALGAQAELEAPSPALSV